MKRIIILTLLACCFWPVSTAYSQDIFVDPIFINEDIYLDVTSTIYSVRVHNYDYEDTLTFKFERTGDTENWLTFNTSEHKVAPSQYKDMDLTFNTTSFEPENIGHSFITELRITSNDPDEDTILYQITIGIIHPITEHFNSVDFSDVYVGDELDSYFHYHNYGSLNVAYTLDVSDDDTTWLSVTPTSGTAQAGQDSPSHTLHIDATDLSVGQYQATITWQSNNYPDITTYITLVVNHPLSVSPTSFSIDIDRGDQTSLDLDVINSHTSNSIAYTLSDNRSWMSVSPTTDTVQASSTNDHVVAIDASDLTNGEHTGTITLSATGYPSIYIPVTIDVEGPLHSISPTSYTLSTSFAEPVYRNFTISNYSTQTMSFNFSSYPHSWIVIETEHQSGSIDANQSYVVPIAFDPHSHEIGDTLRGNIVLQTSGPESATDTIPCQLAVVSEYHPGDPTIILSCSHLEFTLYQEQDTTYDCRITNDGGDTLVVTNITEDCSWLSFRLLQHYPFKVPYGTYQEYTLTVDASGLSPGQYSADILFYHDSPFGENPRYTPITLEVLPTYKYLPGDANMYVGIWPPAIITSDVTYLVSYFRGIQPACLLDGFYASGDANGDCQVISSDITYFVNYFRGLVDLMYCEDYPPSWPTTAALPDSAPSGWPNCE